MLKVVHVSTHDIAGGAARAALRIHRGLSRIGVDSSMVVAVKGGDDPRVSEVKVNRELPARARRWRLRRRLRADWKDYQASLRAGSFERFSDDRTELGADLPRHLPPADVLHLHWVVDLLDYRSFFRWLPPGVPLVWTLHDMNPFTGGCHYDRGCGRFTAACGACPQLGSADEDDLSRAIWRRKQAALASVASGRLQVVTGSQWLRQEVQSSSLLGRFPVAQFQYGLDTEVFSPRDRLLSRTRLGIDPNASVLLFVADSIQNERKGFALLVAALRQLPGDLRVHLLSVGKGKPAIDSTHPHHHVDWVNDDDQLAAMYSAADLFVAPSLQEAYGQTTLEALGCGTPAVGFRIGGIPEVIRHGETGMLVEPGDSARLAAAIGELLRDPATLARMRARSREVAVQEHALHIEAGRYLSLYESLLGSSPS